LRHVGTLSSKLLGVEEPRGSGDFLRRKVSMRRLLLTFSYSMAMALGGTTTFADFAPPTCGTCSGSIYTLSYDAIGTNKFRITFLVDTSHYTGGGSLLDDVASKVSSHNPTSVSLVSAPNGAGEAASPVPCSRSGRPRPMDFWEGLVGWQRSSGGREPTKKVRCPRVGPF